jgi:hypothetical protein
LIGHQQQNGIGRVSGRSDTTAYRTRDARRITLILDEEPELRAARREDLLPVVADHEDAAITANGFREAHSSADQGQTIPLSELFGRAKAIAFSGREDDREY